LSTGGNTTVKDLLGTNRKAKSELVEYLIIDEACQTSELMSLVPVINMRPQKIILIGDHKQLPATLFCDNANFTRLERSLFERLHDGGKEIYTLTTQYRMHPDIRKFPSDQFYDGKLTDAAYINSSQRALEFG
jgi:senataxin